MISVSLDGKTFSNVRDQQQMARGLRRNETRTVVLKYPSAGNDMLLFNWFASSSIPPVVDRFISLSGGSAHILNVCDFVETHRAEIIEIWESGLLVQIGSPWYRRWLEWTAVKPVRVSLSVQPGSVPIQMTTYGIPSGRYCTIDVEIQPRSMEWRPAEFEQASRKLLWSLRSSFMACHVV